MAAVFRLIASAAITSGYGTGRRAGRPVNTLEQTVCCLLLVAGQQLMGKEFLFIYYGIYIFVIFFVFLDRYFEQSKSATKT